MDLCSRVNCRGTQAARGIGTAVDVNRPAASVGSDCCGGLPTGSYVKIIGVGCAAACSHDAAGTVAGSSNGRITDRHCGAVTGGSVLPAVAAVAEHAVCPVRIRGNCSAGDGGRRTVFHKYCRIQTVEVAIVAAVRITCFRHGRIRDRDFIRSADQQSALVCRGTGICLSTL